jgi:hypothetical protein
LLATLGETPKPLGDAARVGPEEDNDLLIISPGFRFRSALSTLLYLV